MRSGGDTGLGTGAPRGDQDQDPQRDLGRGPVPGGKLYVVGLGPGGPQGITRQALDALAESQVVLGYKTYLTQAKAYLGPHQEAISSGMTKELDRAAQALEMAADGRVVSLVSGGDPGVYAMAGVVFEAAKAKGLNLEPASGGLEVVVVAGVPALAASAALLGAPLTHDFACVSLSDRLTPWEVIERRLEAAAGADFVIVLYNPRSQGRDWQLDRALEIVGHHRDPQTPLGIACRAGREGQRVWLTSLGQVDTSVVDMQTLVVVGNSHTFNYQGRMVTPRGYVNKYGSDWERK